MDSFNVGTAFEKFCKNLRFSDAELSKIRMRYHNITQRINKEYWDSTSDSDHSLYVGSYGRDTEVFSSDIDMLIQLPFSTYQKFNAYFSNGQSALLQEVKKVIEKTYPTTSIKGDGQIISVHFSDGINFEVLPAFLRTDNTYLFANANLGGSWKITDPKAEINAIRAAHNASNYNLKKLCKMVRAWRDENNVDISGILIDIMCYNFISSWEYKDMSYFYYDWMTRDFMKYLSEQPTTQTKWRVMGSGRYIFHSSKFQAKAKAAYEQAIEAISYEKTNPILANLKWRGIYGNKFPIV